jgi:hypothetical protein
MCCAWDTICLDTICGVEQNGSTYRPSIHEHFYKNKNSGEDRNENPLSHRSHIILWSYARNGLRHENESNISIQVGQMTKIR